MSKNQTPEQIARDKIDKMLEKNVSALQSRHGQNFR